MGLVTSGPGDVDLSCGLVDLCGLFGLRGGAPPESEAWGQAVMLLNLLRSAGIIAKWTGSKYLGSARLPDRERSPSLVAWNKLS